MKAGGQMERNETIMKNYNFLPSEKLHWSLETNLENNIELKNVIKLKKQTNLAVFSNYCSLNIRKKIEKSSSYKLIKFMYLSSNIE